jgi:hypothetical protein
MLLLYGSSGSGLSFVVGFMSEAKWQQNEQPNSYQKANENTDHGRGNVIPTIVSFAIGRLGSGFLRRSDIRPEAKVIH